MTAVAWVAGHPLSLSEVDSREHAIRSTPAGPTLPATNTAEARQLRRWLVQLLAAERLITTEAHTRGIGPDHAPPLSDLAPTPAALLELGSVAAALLTQNPLARAVFPAITAHVNVDPADITRYHRANPEQFHRPERRLIRHAITRDPDTDPHLADRPLTTLRRGELVGPVEDAAFAATPGTLIGPIRDPLGWHTLRLEAIEPAHFRPEHEVRPEIEHHLLTRARRRAFTAWLDGRIATQVRLAPGYEHPGDPHQPDNTHRH